MTGDAHHLKVEVFSEDGTWTGLPVGVPGYMGGDMLPWLFADGEFSKHSMLNLPKYVPVSVEYVEGTPETGREVAAAYYAFMALPPHLRPQVLPWDHDNDRPEPEAAKAAIWQRLQCGVSVEDIAALLDLTAEFVRELMTPDWIRHLPPAETGHHPPLARVVG
jgi:hypothetical protein